MAISQNLTPRRQEILGLLMRSRSLSTRAIADKIGIRFPCVATHLVKLQALNLVCRETLAGHASSHWSLRVSIDDLQSLIKQQADIRRAKLLAGKSTSPAEQHAVEAWETGPTQRVVPAADCPRVRISAPVSVFGLACA